MNAVSASVVFRRLGKIPAPFDVKAKRSFETSASKEEVVLTTLVNLRAYGYKLSNAGVIALLESDLDATQTATYLSSVTDVIKAALGANKKYKPMYPNFPKQAAKASDFELFVNAMVHYYGDEIGIRIMPNYKKKDKKDIKESDYPALAELGVVGVSADGKLDADAARAEYLGIFTSLMTMKAAWGTAEVEDAAILLAGISAEEVASIMPPKVLGKEVITKENLGHLVGINAELLGVALDRAETATDVLRIAAAFSGSSPALSGVGVEPVKFASFSRPVRRAFLGALERIADGAETRLLGDMARNIALWKTFAFALRAGDYAKAYPTTYAAITSIRNRLAYKGGKYLTFASAVEESIAKMVDSKKSKDTEANAAATTRAIELLVGRPGEFARRLDHVLRSTATPDVVLDNFENVAGDVATNVLWQVRNFYLNRASFVDGSVTRAVVPKGSTARASKIVTPLPKLSKKVIARAFGIIDGAIASQYVRREPLGKVFIDPVLNAYTVPFGARSASKSLNPVGRGTRVPLEGNGDVVRFFIWWKDGSDRTDIDLSAQFYSEDFYPTSTIAYYNLRDSDLKSYHSGDITSAPSGAAEFIDIELGDGSEIARNNRYVVMSINSFTRQNFSELPEVFAGAMLRPDAGKTGKNFDARTVVNAFDVSSASKMATPLMIDLKTREIIWLDFSLDINAWYSNNVMSNALNLQELIQTAVTMKQPTIGDVLAAHRVRGKLVKSAEDADVVFSISRGRLTMNGEFVSASAFLSDWV